MSKCSIEKISCPVCGKSGEFKIWDNLNTDLDKEAQQQLLDGKLFLFECEKCGNSTHVFYPCLYNDVENKVMIHLVEEKEVSSTVQTLKLTEQRMKEINLENLSFKLPGMDLSYRKRIVTNEDSLREKAIIFNHGLDDRVIEIIKLLYYIKACEDHPNLHINDVYFFIENNQYKLQFIGDKMFSAIIQDGLYNDVQRIYIKEPKSETDFIIDMLWANNILKKMEARNE